MRPSLILGWFPRGAPFFLSTPSMSTSSSIQQMVQQDYEVEACSKFPLPPYPCEDDYKDPVCYEHDCKRYEDVKLKGLDKQDAWAKQEQVADAEHAAIAT